MKKASTNGIPQICLFANLLTFPSQHRVGSLCMKFNTMDALGSLLIKVPWAELEQGSGSPRSSLSLFSSFQPLLFRF